MEFHRGLFSLIFREIQGQRAADSEGGGVCMGKAGGGVEHQGQSSETWGAEQGARANGVQ